MNLSMALQSFISTTVILFASVGIGAERRVSPLYLSMNACARIVRARDSHSRVDGYGLFHGTQTGFPSDGVYPYSLKSRMRAFVQKLRVLGLTQIITPVR